jgi:cysteine desulfurase
LTVMRTYLDYNATAPLRPQARAAMIDALDLCGNASSVHAEGRRARALIEDAREKVAALVGARPANVVFTGGGTEANVAALAPANAGGQAAEAICLVSAVEHVSVLAGGRFGPGAVPHLPVTSDGVVDVAAFAGLIGRARAEAPTAGLMVSVMAANNETGVVQPVAEIARLAHEQGAVVHCDAVQAAGRMPVSIEALGADLLSLSAHKIGGPQGVGALVMKSADGLKAPLMTGGGQEMRRRAGTENVAAIAGFGAAAAAALDELPRSGRVRALRDALEAGVRTRAPEAVVLGAGAERLANTSCVAAPGLSAETAVIALDLAGVSVSAGSACSSGKVERSHVLAAMGVPGAIASAAIRVSLGWATEESDIERFLDAWTAVRAQARARRPAA